MKLRIRSRAAFLYRDPLTRLEGQCPIPIPLLTGSPCPPRPHQAHADGCELDELGNGEGDVALLEAARSGC
jgi:hypothetical protein